MLKKLALFFLYYLFFFIVPLRAQQESILQDVSEIFIDKLVILAKANYPKVKAYEHNINIAKLNISKAKVDWLSIATFNINESPTNSTSASSPSLNGTQYGVGTSFGAILTKPYNVKAAKEELKIAELAQQEYNLNIETLVKQKYISYILQLKSLNWRLKALETAESTVKEVKHKFENGELKFDDYNRSLSLYSSAVQSRLDAEAAYLIAKCNLEEIIGIKIEDVK